MLERWTDAWSGGEEPCEWLRVDLLARREVLIIAGCADSRIFAGAIVHTAGLAANLSNVFSVDGDLDAAWSGCVAVLHQRVPDVDVVGYASGDALDAAHRNGFESVAPLRVWVSRA